MINWQYPFWFLSGSEFWHFCFAPRLGAGEIGEDLPQFYSILFFIYRGLYI